MQLERRQYERTHCSLTASYRNLDALDKDTSPCFAMIKDISKGGVRLVVSRFLPLSNRVYLYMDLPNRPTVATKLELTWTSELPQIGRFEIGARFAEIADQGVEYIQDFQKRA